MDSNTNTYKTHPRKRWLSKVTLEKGIINQVGEQYRKKSIRLIAVSSTP